MTLRAAVSRVTVTVRQAPAGSAAYPESWASAPPPSVVTAVRVSGGQPFATGSVLVQLAPKLARLEAELAVPARVVAHLETGQQVSVRYDAFPYSEFGAARGTIISVNLMPSRDVNGTSQVPSHRVRVSLDHQFVSAAGRQIPLGPGMSLSADIILGERSFLEWLFEPSQTMAAST